MSSKDSSVPTERADGSISLRMPSDLDALERTIEAVTTHCIGCGLPGRTARFNLRVALAEALSNAVIYGNSSDPDKRVRIDVRVRDVSIEIQIADEGAGFDPDVVPDPTTQERLSETSGRGIFLIRQLVDDVTFNDQGNVICLVMRRG